MYIEKLNYSVSQKTTQVVSQNFINSQHLRIIFGTNRPYCQFSIDYVKKCLNLLRTI